MIMTVNDHIKAFIHLGKLMKDIENPDIQDIQRLAFSHNGWFDETMVNMAFKAWSRQLEQDHILEWINKYDLSKNYPKKNLGIISAGNVPLVGLHDLLCGLITGHKVFFKASSKDSILMKWVIQVLSSFDNRYKDQLNLTEQLKDIDAVIATGSNNTSRYFEQYFGKFPNIIRKNRTSVGILYGDETEVELKALGNDIFGYYGLGCRNISKIFIPENYDIKRLFEALSDYEWVMDNNKYKNNYDYNCTLWLMNKEEFLTNNFLMIKESAELVAPTSAIYTQRYSNSDDLKKLLGDLEREQIQCYSSKKEQHVDLGNCQNPNLWDYADNIDTISFLLKL